MAHTLTIEPTSEIHAAVNPRRVPLPRPDEASFPFNPKLVEKSLRRRGIVGPLTDEFVAEVAWSNFAVSATKALDETGLYGPRNAASQAYIDDLLSLSEGEARGLSDDHRFAVVTRRALQLAEERLAA